MDLKNSFSRTYCSVAPTWSSMFRTLRKRKRPDPVESPRLTPTMVTSILQMNEEQVTLPKGGPVMSYVVNQLQANKPIEDRHVQGRLVHGRKGTLFGVIDGHLGCACAQILSETLLNYVAVAMADRAVLQQICDGQLDPMTEMTTHLGGASPGEDSATKRLKESELEALQKMHLVNFARDRLAASSHGGDEPALDVKEALESAFLRQDRDITSEATPASWARSGKRMDDPLYMDVLAIASTGAVACLAFVDGADIYVANVGDSDAVMGVYVADHNRWDSEALTNVHVASNPAEVERLTSRHPNEAATILRNGRLFGRLMPLRAFGDARFKWAEADFQDLLQDSVIDQQELLWTVGEKPILDKYFTPPYLDAQPEVVRYKLTTRDKFLVLATDGLWDCTTHHAAVELVGRHKDGAGVLVNYSPPEGADLKSINDSLIKRSLSLKNRSLDSNAATHLLRSALGWEHGEVSAQLTLPQPIARSYRDDITVVVVYFDSQFILESQGYRPPSTETTYGEERE